MIINAEKVLKDIIEAYEQEYPTATGAFDEFVTKIIPNIIKNQPAVDAVPIVRCQKCEHRKEYECDNIRLGDMKCGISDNWFCADGKEKCAGE